MPPAGLLAFIPTAVVVTPAARADCCYTDGETFDLRNINFQPPARLACGDLVGTYDRGETRYSCIELACRGSIAEIWVEWLGEGSGQLTPVPCGLRLTRDMESYEHGGERVANEWFVRVRPSLGRCKGENVPGVEETIVPWTM